MIRLQTVSDAASSPISIDFGELRIGPLSAQLRYLRRRSHALDVAVVLGALGGAATCGAVLILFVGALREATTATVLFALFGLAVACTLGAIVAFTAEMLMAGFGIRAEVAQRRRSVNDEEAVQAPEPHAGEPAQEASPSPDGGAGG